MSQEQQFSQFPYRLTSHGVVARFANDSLPDHAYVNMLNMEVRQENAVSIRFGRVPLSVNTFTNANQPLGGLVNTLGRLKGLAGATWRYASAAGSLYRIAGDAPGSWLVIATGLSTSRCSMVSYTPPFSSTPYEYIADANKMLQDNGVGAPSAWGILWPVQAIQAQVLDIYNFMGTDVPTADVQYTFSGVTSHSLMEPVNTTASGNIVADQLSSVAPAAVTGISPDGFFSVTSDGSIVPVQAQYIDAATPPNVWFQSAVNAQYNLAVVRTAEHFVTASSGTSYLQRLLTFNWGFAKSPVSSPIFQLALRLNVVNPSDLTSLQLVFSTADGTFTSGYTYNIPITSLLTDAESVINIPISSLVPYGPSPNIGNLVAFRIQTAQTAAVTINYYSINLDFGQGPTILGGVDYDYLYTYFNANTGDESGPSPLMLPGGLYPPVGLFYGVVLLQWKASSDPRVTHVRIYRRGGTLPNAFNLIAQVMVGATSFLDNVSDAVASTGSQLNIDNYPPITSTLPVPVSTELSQPVTASLFAASQFFVASTANMSVNQQIQVGAGSTQETVVATFIGSNYFLAYAEFNHNAGEQVYAEAAWAQPVNIVQVGFDRLFLAGDPFNPARLYFSNVGAPSSFGVENYLDLDDSTDPIRGVTPVAFGRMYVFTLGAAVYQVYSVSGSVPVQVRTNATHGMFSMMAFIMMDAGVPYLSNDGIYLFNGSTSTEVSQFVQWVFREYSEAAGPIPVMDLTKREQVVFGFYYDEVFVAYPAIDGNTYRLIYSARDNRWRNDTIPATAMNYEKDTAALIYGDATGMVYQDRVGDVDQTTPTVVTPIPFELTTSALDQGFPKNPKVYQEVTVDINTRGQNVTVSLLFNNLSTPVVIGVVNTTGRQQVNLTVNGGEGISSVNAGFDLAGTATANIDVYELHFQALVDTEFRKDFDSYWAFYGTRGWKAAKQGYWDYVSTTAITVACFLDGNMTAPAFTFTLPSTNGNRDALWVRFPAFKAQSYRWIGESAGDAVSFQIYDTSYIEVKPLCGQKGYAAAPLAMGGN